MKLYRIEKVKNEFKETFIRSFKSEKEAFQYMSDLENHMVNFGYEVKSKDLDHLIVEKENSWGTTYKRFELE